MNMTRARLVFAIVVAIQAMIALAIQQDVFPRWTAYLLLAGTGVQAFMSSIGWSQSETGAARAAARIIRTGSVMCLAFASLVACVKGASVQSDPNGGVDACVEIARKCNCVADGGLVDVGFGR